MSILIITSAPTVRVVIGNDETLPPGEARTLGRTRKSKATQVMQAVSLSSIGSEKTSLLQRILVDIWQFAFGSAVAGFIAWYGPRHNWPTGWVAVGITFGVIAAAPQIVRTTIAVLGQVLDLIIQFRGAKK